jgi:hypothetical protein
MSQFDETIPASVRHLVDAHIKSVIALEVLLLLYDQPQRDWSEEEVAAELRIDVDWTVAQLKELHNGGFICQTAGVPSYYRYYPATLDLNAAIAAMARLYRECPLSMISAIYQKPSVANHLANAFRLRG